jgi:UDP-galactopyranose mutase
MLNTRWQDIKDQITFNRMLFTGAIDEFYEYKHGELPYRSLRFDVETHAKEQYQSAAVINYPNEFSHTRITEQKWLTGQANSYTTTVTEYPLEHVNSETIPYYPIPTDENRMKYKLYQDESNASASNIIFAGRLAEYMYYNMDQAVARALKLSRGLADA